jgi:hypothetical protein
VSDALLMSALMSGLARPVLAVRYLSLV